MFFYLVLAGLSYLVYTVVNRAISLRRNIALAKSWGLPYVVLPFHEVGIVRSAFIDLFFLPFLRRFAFTEKWIWPKFMDSYTHWKNLRKYISNIGDFYVTLSPTSFHFTSINAEINTQISNRRTEFEKPVEIYKIVNVFGRNTLTSDGPDWKRQRKIISPGFTERNNARVWEVSLTEGQKMLEYWASKEGSSTEEMKVENTATDTATLALHIICGAGFGIPQIWPHEDESALGDKKMAGLNTKKPARGHDLTFKESLVYTTSLQIAWFGVLPEWVLRKSPFKAHRKLLAARDDCMFYFKELIEQKRNYRRLGFEQDATDLIAPLVKASDDAERSKAEGKGPSLNEGLSEEEITGNTFIIMFAGHETTANVIHFSFLFLAINLAAQRRLQSEIDERVGTRPTSSWSYQVDMRNLFNSMVGGVLHETIRLMPPVVHIPKINRGVPKQVSVDGKTISIPGGGSFIHMECTTLHRSRRYYPYRPSKITDCSDDLDDFVPERWLQKNANDAAEETSEKEVDGMEVASFEVHGSLFRPVKGAYMPFSEGPRACPGRRFAEVEVIAVLSSVFKQYSVELDLRAWATDEELDQMSKQQKIEIYGKAQKRARELIRGSIHTFTLQMEGDTVPVRFVKRGGERFADLGL